MPFPSPRVFPSPGIQPRSPALPVDSLPSEPQGKPWACCTPSINEPGERKEDLTTGRIDVMKGSLGDKEGAAREVRGTSRSEGPEAKPGKGFWKVNQGWGPSGVRTEKRPLFLTAQRSWRQDRADWMACGEEDR